MTADSFDLATKRILRLTLAVGFIGVLALLMVRGPHIAAGFLLGTILSLVNLRWWTMVANAIGGSGSAPSGASAMVLSLRYLLIAGAIYVIVRILKITPVAPLAGLLVSVAAVMLEALYELIYART
jgi:hypothetical protein